jgi:rare lipoprotein A
MKQRIVHTTLINLVIIVLLAIIGCSKHAASSVHKPVNTPAPVVAAITSQLQCIQSGVASWYGTHMKGRLTASGEKYDPKTLTAASRKFPFGTKVNVINLKNDQNVTVTVNDRGPYYGKRIIDMSVAAAHKLGMEISGLTSVCVQSMEQRDAQAYYNRGLVYFGKKDFVKTWEYVHKAESLGYKVDPKFLEELKKASGREK